MSGSIVFTSVGGALDVGWQWQPGPWIVGAGVGVQYTKLSTHFSLLGFPVYAVVADGWGPRLAFKTYVTERSNREKNTDPVPVSIENAGRLY